MSVIDDTKPSNLPKDKYILVSVDVDTTGRRLIDEIVQLSAYTPKAQFAEYIMPIMNLNPAARQRHQIRVITVGFFRMLKSMQTYKVVKTKTEIAVLKDFLDWLEKLRKDDPESKGIILIHHEQRKFVPYMLLEALQKYDLVARFMESVKSFCDGFTLSLERCGNPVKYFSILQTAKVLQLEDLVDETKDKDGHEFDGCATIRTKLAYEIVRQIAKDKNEDLGLGKNEDLDKKTATKKMQDLVVERASPIQEHFTALDDQNKCMDRQNSMRPIFVNYFKVTLYHRVRGVTFRRVLADQGFDHDTLKELWNSKQKDGLVEVVSAIEELNDDGKKELIDILDCYFDPDKRPILPIIKRNRSKRRQSIQKDNNKGRNQQDDNGKKGGNYDAKNTGNNANNMGNNANNKKRAPRRPRNRFNSTSRTRKGVDLRQQNGGIQQNAPMVAAN